MSDDVKVKFGGDFSDIDKDAQSASKRIGTALGAWVNEYTGELKHKLKDAFSLGNIIEKYGEGVMEYFKKFENLANMSKKLGVSITELQQFGRLGEETGVDMETMGQSIAFANRQLGGMKDNEKIRKLMLDLGFSTKEVTSANIKSLDVLYKLADAYEKTKEKSGEIIANNELAKNSSDLFGRSAYNLNGIIKEGTTALKERIEAMKIFSETEVKMAASTSKMIKKGKEFAEEHTVGSTAGLLGFLVYKTKLFGAGSGGLFGESMEEEKTNKEGILADDKKMKAVAKRFYKKGKKEGLEGENLAEMLEFKIWQPGSTESYREMMRRIQNEMYSLAREERIAKKKNGEEIPIGQTSVMAASSLQQIGGGDVSSVMGVYSVADNIRRTADATEKMAEQDQSPTIKKNITSVAK